MDWLWHMTYWQGRMFEFAVTLVFLIIWFGGSGVWYLIKKRRNKR